MDSFEWSDGYRIHFGLYRVSPETRERTPTKVVQIFQKVASANSLPSSPKNT